MNKAEFRTALLARLGQRQDDLELWEQLQSELTLVQEQLERESWAMWLLAQEQVITVPALSETVELKAIFGWPNERAVWEAADGTRILLSRTDSAEMFTAASTDADVPGYYAHAKDAIRLYPAPLEDGTLHFWGLMPQPSLKDLAETETNVWLERAAEYLMGDVGARAALFYTRDSELALAFAEMRKLAKTRLFTEMIAAEQADRLIAFGGDD